VVKCHECKMGHLPIDGQCNGECFHEEQCAPGSCNIAFHDVLLCSRCNEGYAPTNGICIEVLFDTGSGCVANGGQCTKCGAGYFLYQGGCYAIGLEGNEIICLEAGTEAEQIGLCKTCAGGFQNNKGICVHCGDPYCKTCNTDINTCEACLDGYYNPSFCTQCHDSCKTCVGEGPKQCLTCPHVLYLLPINGDIGMCVAYSECGDGMYGRGATGRCTPCSSGCLACVGLESDRCTSCPIRTYFLDDSGSGVGRCVECGDTTHPKGIAGCRECSSEDGPVRCLVCSPGHTLVDGKCQSHCQDPTNCAEGSCVVGIGENLYCRLCKTSGYAPVDGICTDITGANPSGCVPGADPDSARSCLRCGAGYFLHMGGCYKEGGSVGKSICI
ncbi:Variant-specific surface protein, partial [Giardia duodenalis]